MTDPRLHGIAADHTLDAIRAVDRTTVSSDATRDRLHDLKNRMLAEVAQLTAVSDQLLATVADYKAEHAARVDETDA